MIACALNGRSSNRSASDVISLFKILSGSTYMYHALHQKDNFGNTPLIHAAYNACDTSLIKLLIQSKANVEDEDNDGRTALCHAVAKTKLISVWKPLAQDHPEIWNKRDNIGMTPLLHAAQNGNYGNLKELVEHYHADVSDVDNNGKTALMYVLRDGNIVSVNYILTQIQAEEVNRVDNYGITPLLQALRAISPNTDIVKKLIASGANISYQTEALDETALMFAIRKGLDINIINQLINDATVNQTDHQGDTPLLYAVHYNKPKSAKSLITAGANLLQGNPLIFAIIKELDINIINQLINDATVNQRDDQGDTPLLYAISCNKPRIVKSLITAGANPLQGNLRGMTPLMYAARKGSVNIVNSLAKIEGTVNQQDIDEKTPLFYAENQTDIVAILISFNANVNHKDKFGKFAIPEEVREKVLELQTNRINKK